MPFSAIWQVAFGKNTPLAIAFASLKIGKLQTHPPIGLWSLPGIFEAPLLLLSKKFELEPAKLIPTLESTSQSTETVRNEEMGH